MRVIGKDCTSTTMTGVTGAPRFPLSFTSDSKVVIGFDFNDLTLDEQEVVQLLNNFELMSSRLLITLDHGDGSGIHEYLGKFVVDKKPLFRGCLFTRLPYIFNVPFLERKFL